MRRSNLRRSNPLLYILGIRNVTTMRKQSTFNTAILAIGLALASAGMSHAAMQDTSMDMPGSAQTPLDCDQNGVLDLDEIAAFPHKDANFNSRLDLCEGLSVDRLTISVSEGGTQTLHLQLSESMAFRIFWMLGTTSDTAPGIEINGVHLPLNYDGIGGYMNKTMFHPNEDELRNTLGFLNDRGISEASITLPPNSDPTLAGQTVHHAYMIVVPDGNLVPIWSSNSVTLQLVP